MGPRQWLAVASEILLATLVTVGVFVSGRFFPVLGTFLGLLSPLPAVVLGLRHGRGVLLLSATLTTVALLGLTAPRQAVVFLLQFAVAGMLLVEGLRRTTRPEGIVVGVATLLTAGGCAAMLFESGSWGQPLSGFERSIDSLMAEAESWNASLGLPTDGSAGLAGSTAVLRSLLLAAFPGVLFTGSLLTAWGYVLLLGGAIRRWPAQLGGRTPEWLRWELPELLVWAFIGAGVLYLSGLPWVQAVGLNGLIVLVGLYFLQGLSITAYLVERFQLPRMLVALSVLVLLFQPLLALALAGVGLFDVWFSFRRVGLPRAPRQS
jgi:uncharacterized protein YybS (DUF2232 family)